MVIVSIWDVVKPSYEAVFLLFHVSVLCCIIRERVRGNINFSTSFYTLYCLQSFFDILLVMTV